MTHVLSLDRSACMCGAPATPGTFVSPLATSMASVAIGDLCATCNSKMHPKVVAFAARLRGK